MNPIRKLIFFIKILGLVCLVFLLTAIYLILKPPPLLFPNSDFEQGDLFNWAAEAEAFRNQPTLGDNVLARCGQKSGMRGLYWVGTYENRHTLTQAKGGIQGDEPQGKLISAPFLISGKRIGFLIGGGDSSALESVSLEVEGNNRFTQCGNGGDAGTEKMSKVIWDVSAYLGQKARIVILDKANQKWGHINADDFKYC